MFNASKKKPRVFDILLVKEFKYYTSVFSLSSDQNMISFGTLSVLIPIKIFFYMKPHAINGIRASVTYESTLETHV